MIALACAGALLFGCGLVAAALPRPAPRLFVLWLGLALGAGASSAAWAAALFLGGADPRLRLAKDALLAAAGAALLVRHRARLRPAAQPASPSPRWLRWLFAAACVVAAALFLEHTLRFRDGAWDAWQIWNLRARWLSRAGDDFRSAFSPDIVFWAHQDYPLLVPGLVAQGFLALGSESFAIPAGVAFALAALAAGLVALSLAALRGPRWGQLGGLVLLATPAFVTAAASQQADVPLGLFVLATAALAALALEEDERPGRLFALAGFAASLAAWTKNEGAVYLLALLAALALAPRPSDAPRPPGRRANELSAFLGGASPVLALLAHFKLGYAARNDLVGASPLAAALGRATDPQRIATLAVAWLRRLVYFQSWALFLVALILVLALVVPRLPARRSTRVLGVWLALSAAAWVPMYLTQPHALLWFFRASIDRLGNQLWPAAVLATLLALAGPERDASYCAAPGAGSPSPGPGGKSSEPPAGRTSA